MICCLGSKTTGPSIATECTDELTGKVPTKLTCGLLCIGRLSIGGSMIGGIRETQEMLDFCGKHNVVCKCEIIPMQYVNTALERLVKNDVKYRFVIDVQGTLLN